MEAAQAGVEDDEKCGRRPDVSLTCCRRRRLPASHVGGGAQLSAAEVALGLTGSSTALFFMAHANYS